VGHRRLRVVAVCVVVAGLILGVRASYLSVVQFEDFQALASESVDAQEIERRGDILSADGRELATSIQADKIVATPYQVKNPEEAAKRLSDTLGDSGPGASEIGESLTARDGEGDLAGYSVVAEEVPPRKALKVEELGIAGISTENDAVREYPHQDLASQLIGYMGDYKKAFGGAEAGFDGTLSSGEDVRLTVDVAVQQQLQKSLDDAVADYDAKGGVGLVMRVEDGAIVGMANSPGYDNNEFAQASPEEQRNRILTDPYEPGSTFKALTMAAALEEGSVSPDDSFSVPDSMNVSGITISDSHEHPTESMTPAEILQESSNVGTTKVAQELGGKKLSEYIDRFGFGEPTGVDLAGEAAGSVPPYSEWSGVSIGNIPFGQGISVTPLQLAAGYATLANGGFEIEPHVSERSETAGSGDRVISGETSDIVRGMLQSVVDDGSGGYAQIPGYSVAGKTGTSEKIDPETGTYDDEYVTSFIGFAPASDPEYLTLIAVDEPQESMWGEKVAAPAFQEIMSFTLSYFNVAPDRPGYEAPRLAGSPERFDEDGLPGYPDAATGDYPKPNAETPAVSNSGASGVRNRGGGGGGG
jgi:cell division protein FtsI/penicillin-binding protein 2